MSETITGYKAFKPDFKCRDYQYEVGKTFEHEGEIRLYQEGFHFCHNDPIVVFQYYPLVWATGESTRLAKVSALKKDTIINSGDDTCVTSKISIDEEITINTLVKAQIEKDYKSKNKNSTFQVASETFECLTTLEHSTRISSKVSRTYISIHHGYSTALISGYESYIMSCGAKNGLFATSERARVSSSGLYAKIFSSGEQASVSASNEQADILVTGEQASVSVSGGQSELCATGEQASVSASGSFTRLRATGRNASVSASGRGANLWVIGDDASVASSGYDASLNVAGKRACVAVAGHESWVDYKGEDGIISITGAKAKFRGSKGTLVSAVVYNKKNKPVDIITGRIGKNGLKPDTFYTVKNGEFIEVGA